jgi:hypothetical protein
MYEHPAELRRTPEYEWSGLRRILILPPDAQEYQKLSEVSCHYSHFARSRQSNHRLLQCAFLLI